MLYLSQIFILYTLNLYSAVCQLYLNKTGENKEINNYKYNHQKKKKKREKNTPKGSGNIFTMRILPINFLTLTKIFQNIEIFFKLNA